MLLCGLTVFALTIRNPYYVLLANVVGLNIIVVIGLNLLIGYTGQISLGHGAFFGMGAYLSGVLTANYGLPPWPTILLAAAVTSLVALLIGMPALKLKGHYLVMATLGFNVIVSICMVEMEYWTGGTSGLPGIPNLAVGPLILDTDLEMFPLIWITALVVLILSLNLVHSRVGRGLRAIHGSEVAAGSLGVNTRLYKIQVFVFSAALASISGSLYAHYITFISPKTFDFFYSVKVVIMVIIGGLGSVWGSLIGAAVITALPELLEMVEEYSVLAYGLILALVLMFFPQGLLPGLLEVLRKQTSHLRGKARI
jgi:branched-chain amino acid transport system permease protein